MHAIVIRPNDEAGLKDKASLMNEANLMDRASLMDEASFSSSLLLLLFKTMVIFLLIKVHWTLYRLCYFKFFVLQNFVCNK